MSAPGRSAPTGSTSPRAQAIARSFSPSANGPSPAITKKLSGAAIGVVMSLIMFVFALVYFFVVFRDRDGAR